MAIFAERWNLYTYKREEYGKMKRIIIIILLFSLIVVPLCQPTSAASGTVWESEDNGSFSLADRTYDDYNSYGYISSDDYNGSNLGDNWKVTFPYNGYANFYLGHIPSGCNYELVVYKADLSGILGYSYRTGNTSELVTVPVEMGKTYYVYIFSISGYSTSQAYLFRTRLYSYNRLGKSLSGGIYNRKYYIGMSSSDYVNPCITAISDWNSLLNSNNNGSGTDFYFTRTYSSASAAIQFWGEYRPSEGWVGLTTFYDSNGNSLSNPLEIPNYTTVDWTRAVIIFNTTEVPYTNSTYMRSIGNHEIGHAIGLDHVGNPDAVMKPGYDLRNTYVPTYHDLKGAEVIYP